MKSKSETLKYFLEFKAGAKLSLHTKVERVRTDNGGEYISSAFQHAIAQVGIHHEFTQAYTSHQNGVSERKNHTLLEKARSMVYEACTPHFLWNDVVNTANYLTNRSRTRANLGITPFQCFYRKPPDLSHLHTLGYVAFVCIPYKQQTKLDPHSVKTILVSYFEQTKGYCFYNPQTRKLIISNDAKIIEHRFWHSPTDLVGPQGVALEPLSDSSAVIEIINPVLPSSPPPVL